MLGLVADHVVLGRVVFPAAAYLEMARVATGRSLTGVHFLQPLAVEQPGLHIECAVIHGRFDVRSGIEEAMSDGGVHCSGALAASAGSDGVDHASLLAGVCACA